VVGSTRAVINPRARYRLTIGTVPMLVCTLIGYGTTTPGWNVGSNRVFVLGAVQRMKLPTSDPFPLPQQSAMSRMADIGWSRA
jgi:hypothetical protein